MANYRIIGIEGREYGPVSQEQIRIWIGEGRVNAATLICAEGSVDWRALSTWQEFRAFVGPLPSRVATAPGFAGIRRTNGWAIWGFVCGVLSLTLCSCCCLPIELFGMVFSVIGLVQISNNPQTQTGTALAILGLVFSVLSIVLGFAFSALWFTSGVREEFLRDLDREMSMRFGAVVRCVTKA